MRFKRLWKKRRRRMMEFEEFKKQDEAFRERRKYMVYKIKQAEQMIENLRTKQFKLIEAHENSLHDLLNEFQKEAKIKWPDYKPPKSLRIGFMAHGG